MTSEEISLIASHPFVKRFVLSIIKTISEQKFDYVDKNAIHADLVPKVSEHVMQASMMSTRIRQPVVQRPAPALIVPQQRTILPPINMPKGGPVHVDGYGKINALINDPSISTIQCDGADKPISVIRAGQRQITKIVLNKEEVQGVLDKVAEDAHIPLLEGVFRAAVNGFAINAVISEMIGSRFVIKKASAYGLLE